MQAKKQYKVGRRLGASVFDKCQTQKFVLSEARHAKNVKGRRKTVSDYAKQLLEKQRVRFAYGIHERQLRRYVEESTRVSALGNDPVVRLIEQLEMRLDNVVYRAGLATSRRAARQLVAHGHVLKNGTRNTVASTTVCVGDTFALRERTRGLPIMERLKSNAEAATAPTWLRYDVSKSEGKILSKPNTETTEMPGSVSAILEYYSR